MTLSELSIRRPVFAWMLMAAILLFGLISFKRLGISQLPDVDFPVVQITLTLTGAAPEIIEAQVLDPLEDRIMEIDGIRSVTSTAQQSTGTIAVEFDLSRDIDESMQELQNKINQVKNLLPVTLLPPTLRKSNPEDQPILWLVLTSDEPEEAPGKLVRMMIYSRNTLQGIFSTVPGVGNIAQAGYVDPALRVWMDQEKMRGLHLTSADLLRAISQGHSERPAGRLEGPRSEYNVRFVGEAASPAQFADLRINDRNTSGPNWRPIRMGDIATVEEGVADVRKISRFNGKRAVGIGILKQHGSNGVEVARLVRQKLAEIQPLLPKGYHLDLRADNTRFIREAVNELLFTLLLSALLTSAVCYLFLGSLTSTVNVLMAIPTSIIGAFTAFYFMGFTLNTFTLLGLSLAIGIVVDDAIMMLENIVRHRELGEGKRAAALKGAEEIKFAALAATIAVVAIFMPVVFMEGAIGRYFYQYGVTVTVAVLLSLLEALTLTPMRCARYLRVNSHPTGLAGFVDRFFARLARAYGAVLGVLLNHRLVTLAVTAVLFALSLQLAKKVPSEMMPAQDQAQLMLRFKLPVGTSIHVTSERMGQVEKFLQAQPEVTGVYSVVGGFGGDAVNQGMAFLTLTDRKERKRGQAELANAWRAEFKKRYKGMQVIVQDLSLRGFSATRGFPVEFIVQGPDWDKLTDLSNAVMDEMRKGGFVTDVNTDIQPGMPEVQITPDRAKLAERGVPLSSVTAVINALVGGAILQGTTEYTKDGHRYAIELRLKPGQREAVTDLDHVMVRNNYGELVPFHELVTKKVRPSLMLISRLNRARAITVYANPAPGHSQAEALELTEKIARRMLPQGYSLKMIGSSQSFRDSFRTLMVAMALGILVSYMVLASQFNSFIHPVTVLMALPFSFSGAFLGLMLFHQTINIYSLIGFILLMGIVKKNSILLVDFTNQMRAEGLGVREALLKACPVRLRPILMTSIATIAGALPEALSFGPGAETTIPMAVAIIGGVMASTLLTLFVVPCVYSALSRFEGTDSIEESSAAPAPLVAPAAG